MATKIYRYKFDPLFQTELEKFSIIHKYEERKDYKESWKKWLEDNNTIIQREMDRLTALGYEGDMEKKMYTSVRYYFKNKKETTKDNETKKRRNYITIDKTILKNMDDFIGKHSNMKPSESMKEYIEENYYILEKEKDKILKNNEDVTDMMVMNKFKKTYKNRYYIFSKKQLKSTD